MLHTDAEVAIMEVTEAQMPTALTHAHELSKMNDQLTDGERAGGVVIADRRPTQDPCHFSLVLIADRRPTDLRNRCPSHVLIEPTDGRLIGSPSDAIVEERRYCRAGQRRRQGSRNARMVRHASRTCSIIWSRCSGVALANSSTAALLVIFRQDDVVPRHLHHMPGGSKLYRR